MRASQIIQKLKAQINQPIKNVASLKDLVCQLYWSKWINYPRSDTRKAEFEPIYPLKDYREYKGSLQEKQVLKIVHEANEAYKQGKNYTETGTWFLHHKGEIMAQKVGIKTPEILTEYDRDSYDIRVIRDGKTKHDIVNFIEDNDIGTPATRMNQWENLIQAGMIKKVGDLYTVDTRGIVMASTYEWYTKNTWNALDMIRDLDTTNNINEYEKVLAIIQPISDTEIDKARETIKVRAEEIIEAQKDLAVLDTF